jgi:hypothetical protein
MQVTTRIEPTILKVKGACFAKAWFTLEILYFWLMQMSELTHKTVEPLFRSKKF